MFDECIRCDDAPALDEAGYCGRCHWAVRVEVDEGLHQIAEYLRAWARFDDWCAARAAGLSLQAVSPNLGLRPREA